MAINNPDRSGRTAFNALEGDDEQLSDFLQDKGIGEMQEGEKRNISDAGFAVEMTCRSKSTEDHDGVKYAVRTVDISWDNDDETTVVTISEVYDDGDEGLEEMYWFDEDGNQVPSSSDQFYEYMTDLGLAEDEL